MQEFAVFLRGVNVGGHAPISMEALKLALGEADFTNVRTVLNSGNLLVETRHDKQTAAREIAELIMTRFEISTEVFVKTKNEIDAILKNGLFDPREAIEPSWKVIIMLSGRITGSDFGKLTEKNAFDEIFNFRDDIIYVYYPKGSGKSKFTVNFIEKKLHVKATGRSLNTLIKMEGLMV